MELRHLRYFVAVAEALNFTKAAAKLRLAQPALSRQVGDLEDEIGVDLFARSPRGVTLTAEGHLFLAESRLILASTDSAVAKTRALARGEYGELHIGYAPSPTSELLPPALSAFQRAAPGVSVRLHDLSGNELGDGLRSGSLHVAVMQRPFDGNAAGLQFELLRSYPMCVVTAPDHPIARLRSVPISRLASEPLVAYSRAEYADHHGVLDRVFAGQSARPRIVAECDGASSLFAEIESRGAIAILPLVFSVIVGRRLRLRPLTPPPPPLEVGIVRAIVGDVTPAGERFVAQLRKIASGNGVVA